MQVLDLSCCPFPLTVVISLSQLGPLAFCFVPFHLDILSRNLDHLPETVLCPTSVSQRVLSVKTFACCCHLENLPRMILYLYPTSVSLSVVREKTFPYCCQCGLICCLPYVRQQFRPHLWHVLLYRGSNRPFFPVTTKSDSKSNEL